MHRWVQLLGVSASRPGIRQSALDLVQVEDYPAEDLGRLGAVVNVDMPAAGMDSDKLPAAVDLDKLAAAVDSDRLVAAVGSDRPVAGRVAEDRGRPEGRSVAVDLACTALESERPGQFDLFG